MRLLIIFMLSILLKKCRALSTIDNGVVGIPLVECGERALAFNANTRNVFTGRVIVQGVSRDKECAFDFSTKTTTNLQITIPFGMCRMQRQRMLQPVGIQHSVTLIVSFHPIFITEVDKAYRLRCSYVLAEKTLTQHLEISSLPTQEIAATLPLPGCEYTVHKNNYQGPLVQYAIVGEPLFHVWRCAAAVDFRMLVRNCVIEDSGTTKFLAIDEKGCTKDRRVVSELRYSNDFKEAFVEMHAFKFADDVNVHFRCEIILCQKTEDACRQVVPPNCENSTINDLLPRNASFGLTVFPITFGASVRNARHLGTPWKDKKNRHTTETGPLAQARSPYHKFILDVIPKNNFYVLDRRIEYSNENSTVKEAYNSSTSTTEKDFCDCRHNQLRLYCIKMVYFMFVVTLLAHGALLLVGKIYA